jgi:hypothetical protein
MVITLTIIYIISVIGAYKFIQKVPRDKNVNDFLAVITPGLNLMLSFCYVLLITEKYRQNINWEKFFNKF